MKERERMEEAKAMHTILSPPIIASIEHTHQPEKDCPWQIAAAGKESEQELIND